MYGPLLGSEFRVVTFDFPNQDGSIDENFYSLTQYCDFFLAKMRQLEVELSTALVVGLSSGANIIRALHCERNINFGCMLLVSPNPGRLSRFYTMVAASQLHALSVGGIEAFANITMLLSYSPRYLHKMPLAASIVPSRFKALFEDRLPALRTLLRHPSNDHTLAKPPTQYRSPVTFVYATSDCYCPSMSYKSYLSACTGPSISVQELDGGHTVSFEDPLRIVAIIKEMFRNSLGNQVVC